LKRLDIQNIKGASAGKNVTIECSEFKHEGNFAIGDNVTIKAEKIYLGSNAIIEHDTKIGAIKGEMQSLHMGDESLIGFNSQVLAPEFKIGDYTRIFNSALCSGYKPITLGHNCWVGQSAILNSAEILTIGNNVRMGGNIQIWTHVASGELLEGCRFFSEKPITIEDNVWLMGFGHTISPGVTLARNSIIMSGSVVSRNTEPYHTYSGIPARDITESLRGWNFPSQHEKFLMLRRFTDEFKEEYPEYRQSVHCLDLRQEDELDGFKMFIQLDEPNLIFLKETENLQSLESYPHTFFDLKTKKYLKKRTPIEIKWMKFSIGHKARFTPLNEI
jgi:acetyltransferase-like isoleucine patch superfamily enzyme